MIVDIHKRGRRRSQNGNVVGGTFYYTYIVLTLVLDLVTYIPPVFFSASLSYYRCPTETMPMVDSDPRLTLDLYKTVQLCLWSEF